jgi:hypothetical protein
MLPQNRTALTIHILSCTPTAQLCYRSMQLTSNAISPLSKSSALLNTTCICTFLLLIAGRTVSWTGPRHSWAARCGRRLQLHQQKCEWPHIFTPLSLLLWAHCCILLSLCPSLCTWPSPRGIHCCCTLLVPGEGVGGYQGMKQGCQLLHILKQLAVLMYCCMRLRTMVNEVLTGPA